MVQEEEFDPDAILRELDSDYGEEKPEEVDTTEELVFEKQKIRDYQDMIVDLDLREKALDIEEPEAEAEPEPTD